MWKMIGPHQALRLERMRTEIERDKFSHVVKQDPFAEIESDKQTQQEQPPPEQKKPPIDAKGNPDDKGYEWIDFEEKKFYRTADSGGEWVEYLET